MVKIKSYVVSDIGEPQLPDAFYRIKKILFLAKVTAFLNLENTGNYSDRPDFNRVFSKITIFWISKHVFYIFYPIILKLNLVVLGVN